MRVGPLFLVWLVAGVATGCGASAHPPGAATADPRSVTSAPAELTAGPTIHDHTVSPSGCSGAPTKGAVDVVFDADGACVRWRNVPPETTAVSVHLVFPIAGESLTFSASAAARSLRLIPSDIHSGAAPCDAYKDLSVTVTAVTNHGNSDIGGAGITRDCPEP